MDQTPDHKPEESRSRGIYLLPNLFTTGSIFLGFFAIVSAMRGHFSAAAVAIFIAAILDALDGRVARMTHTESRFGAEYDSLADIVSFGIAPALVVYTWALQSLYQIGWLIAFIFVACAGLRLAKFNANLGKGGKRYFIGLPVPSAAACVAGMVWVGHEDHLASLFTSIVAALITLYVAVMMVSNIKYRSFKDFDLRGRFGFTSVLVVVGIYACIAIDPTHVLFIVFILYALSGPVIWGWCYLKGIQREDDDHVEDVEPDTQPETPAQDDSSAEKQGGSDNSATR